jgi:hypothetical protein
MFITKKHLSRRTVLRGAFGAAIGLPFLDAMAPAASAAQPPQLRFGRRRRSESSSCRRCSRPSSRCASTSTW